MKRSAVLFWLCALVTLHSLGFGGGEIHGQILPGDGAPSLLSQPEDTNVLLGARCTVSVSAAGTPPLRFQWRFHETNFIGSNDSVLTLSNVQPHQSGAYSVVVENGFGAVTSAPAMLRVRRRPGVTAWGWNNDGQSTVPPNLTNAVAIAAGAFHSLALRDPGHVLAWGYGEEGQTLVPPALTDATAVDAARAYSLALRRDGTLLGWGRFTPPEVALTNVVALAAGSTHALALLDGGTIVAWGANDFGQTRVPSEVSNVVAVSSGENHNLALRDDGTVVAWGDDTSGQATVPAAVSNVVAISAGYTHSLALQADGTLVAWGILDGAAALVPEGLSNVIAIAAGNGHSLALRADGRVTGWGNDSEGQATPPPELGGVVALAAGSGHSLALVGDGAPFLTVTPSGRTREAGGPVTLQVVAAGLPPLHYQWRRDGAAIPEATAGTLEFPTVRHTNAGAYTVVISNLLGSVTSAVARLTVTGPVPAPDLRATALITPASALAGRSVSLVWVVTNQGPLEARGPWTEAVALSADAFAGDDESVTSWVFTNALPPGGFLARTQEVIVPLTGPAGSLRFVVAVDVAQSVAEQDEGNNVAVAAQSTFVPPALALSFSATHVAEAATNAPIRVTVFRNGAHTAPLLVTLGHDTPGELAVPADITIPALAAFAGADLLPLRDGVVDGPRTVQISASASGILGATGQVTVLDADVPRLFLALSAALREGSQAIATLTREFYTNDALLVLLASSAPDHLAIPPFTIIPAGRSSITFSAEAVENPLVEPERAVFVLASAAGFLTASNSLTLADNDTPQLHLAFIANPISEGAGPLAGAGRVTRVPVADEPLTVTLETAAAGLTNLVVLPATITIPAGEATVPFPIGVVDNREIDGTRAAAVTAYVTDSLTGRRILPGISSNLFVTDDDSLTLRISAPSLVLAEGLPVATRATVVRLGPTNASLLVTLASSNPDEATVPASVFLAPGQASAAVPVATHNDGVSDGDKAVVLSATAPGYETGYETIVVTDRLLPDLVVASVTGPASAEAGAVVNGVLIVENRGLSPATNDFHTRVFISGDGFVGDDALVAETVFRGALTATNPLTHVVAITLPAVPGLYWIVALVDAAHEVDEVMEHNNHGLSTQPIRVESAYAAVVRTDVLVTNSLTPVRLRGEAHFTGAVPGPAPGAAPVPAPHQPVDIHVRVRGTERVLSTSTDINGEFEILFQPLPGEAGYYEVFAAPPGVNAAPAQDDFHLVSLRAQPAGATHAMLALSTVTNFVSLSNPGATNLSGLVVTVLGAPLDLVVRLDAPGTLAPGQCATLRYTVEAVTDAPLEAEIVLHFASAEGATFDFPVRVTVEPLRPRLLARPAALWAGMLRGRPTLVELDLVNAGGRATAPLGVAVSPAPWLHLASPASLPALAPGATARVTLQLRPAGDLPLGDYQGGVFVSTGEAPLTVPFTLRALSDATGSLCVEAVDEYTYYAEGAPRVTNATVTLTDAVTGTTTDAQTDGAGKLLLAAVREGYYHLLVAAADHTDYGGTIFVAPGQTNFVTAFLSRQTVQYFFTVEPITVDDRTRIELEVEFETLVPIPVLTIHPALIDLADVTNDVTPVTFVITNHGLVAARDLRLEFGTHPQWRIEPLVQDLGTLPAQGGIAVPAAIFRLSPTNCLDPHTLQGGVKWTVPSGPFQPTHTTPIYFINASPRCPAELRPEPFPPPSPTSPSLPSLPTCCGGSPGPGPGPSDPPGPPSIITPPVIVVTPDPCGVPCACGVCVRVGVRVEPQLVVAREAFSARLELHNSLPNPLTDVLAQLSIHDAAGAPADGLFVLQIAGLNQLTATDGSGVLAPNRRGSVRWILIPTVDAASALPVTYTVGGTLAYEQNGLRVRVPLAAVPVTVYPTPRLRVDFFHQRDVFSDDPFTPALEPPEPFSLGVLLRNLGQGPARNLRLTVPRPQIVDDAQGLSVAFNIVGAEVNGQARTPSLTAEFGDLGSGDISIARWLLTASVHGHFVSYSSSFEHIDAVGRARLAFVEHVGLHEMIRAVRDGRPGTDNLPDFLANESPDPDALPDRLYLSTGHVEFVAAVRAATANRAPDAMDPAVELSLALPPGWAYARVTDPGQGRFRLVDVQRPDGSHLPPENFWLTDRTFAGGGQRPVSENLFHLLDYDGTGPYTLVYSTSADIAPPSSAVAALPAQSYTDIPVIWTGEDGPGGAGVACFDVFVAVNDGTFLAWLQQTRDHSAVYPGQIGNEYAFYSVATDFAGNREAAPAAPDAQTRVALTNRPPQLLPLADFEIDERTTLVATARAIDPDVPPQRLTFALLPGSPPGAVIDPARGTMTWPTGEAHGDSTNVFTVTVTDNGNPPWYDRTSFTVIVRDVNTGPRLAPIPTQGVNVGELLLVTNRVIDADLPRQGLRFSVASATVGSASITPGTGIFRWRPSRDFASTTQHFAVVVTDEGRPSLGATQSFAVIVNDFLALGLGSTIVRTGQRGTVPVTVFSSADTVELRFTLEVSSDRLTDVILRATRGSFSLQSDPPDRTHVGFSSSQPLLGDVSIGDVGFVAVSNRSAFVPLRLMDISALRASGTRVPAVSGQNGRVVVIGGEPLLEASLTTNQARRLTLYGIPGASYLVESAPHLLPPIAWSPAGRVPLTDLFRVLEGIDMTAPELFFRAQEFVADPPRLELATRPDGTVTLIVFGQPGVLVEGSSNVADPAAWTAVPSFTLTNSFRLLDIPNQSDPVRFFRARRP